MVKDRHAASTEAVVAAQMRKTIQSGRAGDSSLTQLLPRREELEKRIRRTGKNWTLTQYMFASMIVFVVAAGAMLMVRAPVLMAGLVGRSEEHTSELQSLMSISYAVFCLKNKKHLHHL